MIKKRNENKNRREIMKILRIITLIISIPLLSSITLTAANARDCSDPKGFHEKMMCKLQNVKSPSETPKKTKKEKSEGSGNSLWKKIKNFGGKNVGEPG